MTCEHSVSCFSLFVIAARIQCACLRDEGVLASPPGQRPAKGARGCEPDFAAVPQSLRGAVLKRETERGRNRVSLEAVRDVEFMKPSAAENPPLRSS